MSYSSVTRYNGYDLGELSRQKLLRVAESSDTLRRAVLIHNIMRSTAIASSSSSAANPSTPPPSPTEPTSSHHHYSPYHEEELEEDDPIPIHVEEDDEADYHRGGESSSESFVFPRMSDDGIVGEACAFNEEQDWLDSILDDLEGEVHVSVVPVAVEFDEAPMTEDDVSHPHALSSPLFASLPPHTTCTPSPPSSSTSSPHASPPLRPTSPRIMYHTPVPPDSPPTSPPGLDVDTIDSDDEDSDEEEDFSEVTTPSASTEFTPSDTYFFNHLPYPRHRHQNEFEPLL
ncbi:hypothetical protein FRB99_008421 [Tulasnella sp. 403]|nr:hypothetical protein FRB99_008421 [Tulasnella sp. 403]